MRATSFGAQGDERIDAHRTPRRQVAGQQRDGKEQDRHGAKGQRMGPDHAIQTPSAISRVTPNVSARPNPATPINEHFCSFAENEEPEDVPASRAKRNPDAHFHPSPPLKTRQTKAPAEDTAHAWERRRSPAKHQKQQRRGSAAPAWHSETIVGHEIPARSTTCPGSCLVRSAWRLISLVVTSSRFVRATKRHRDPEALVFEDAVGAVRYVEASSILHSGTSRLEIEGAHAGDDADDRARRLRSGPDEPHALCRSYVLVGAEATRMSLAA